MLPLPRLRTATATDAAGIVALLTEAARDGLLGLDPDSLRVDEEAARLASIDPRMACALVVATASRVVGFAVAVRAPEPSLQHTASISLAVAASARRRGLGRLLLGGITAWARAAGVRKLAASVCERNPAGLALFHRAGYAVEGVRRQQINIAGVLADEVLFGVILPGPATEAAEAQGEPAPN